MRLLDGVRGLAIVLVLCNHLIALPIPAGGGALQSGLKHLAGYGALGVDLFFALSGFLITGILYDSRSSKSYFKSFYARRALRIFPLHYISIAVLLFVVPALVPGMGAELAPTLDHQAWVWLYAVNIRNAIHGDITLPYVDHYWSLGVEEHFYFVWPFVVRLFAGAALRRVAFVVAAISAVACIAALALGINPIAVYVLTPFRLDLLCAGAFFSLLVREGGIDALRRPARILLGIGLVMVVVSFPLQSRLLDVGREVRAIGMHVLVAAFLAGVITSKATALVRGFLESRVMVFFGKYSYGLYVIHGILGVYLMNHGFEPWLAARTGNHLLAVAAYCAFATAVSIALALLSYHLFEKRFLELKRFFPMHEKVAKTTLPSEVAA